MVYGKKHPDMIIAFVACLLAERTYIPIDSSLPRERLLSIIEQAKPSLCITREPFHYDIPHAPLSGLGFVPADASSPSSDAYLIFTSGSSGTPKGVVVTRENLSNFIHWVSSIPALQMKQAHVLNQASFSFDLSVADIYYSLANGHTLHLLKSSYPDLYQDIQDIEVMFVTPSFMKLLLMDPHYCSEYYPRLKTVVFCGEALQPSTVEKLFSRFDIQVVNAYGPTEACCMVSSSQITRDMCKKAILPCGDLSQAAVSISLQEGEIILQGKSVAKGYLSGKQFNGTYSTGDMGILQGNNLYCLGRKDRQVKYKGYRIELDEIESVIQRLEGVQDCTVTASRTQEGIVKRIHAYVVTDMPAPDIARRLEAILPSYMIPVIHIKERLSLNAHGKTDRKALEHEYYETAI